MEERGLSVGGHAEEGGARGEGKERSFSLAGGILHCRVSSNYLK